MPGHKYSLSFLLALILITGLIGTHGLRRAEAQNDGSGDTFGSLTDLLKGQRLLWPVDDLIVAVHGASVHNVFLQTNPGPTIVNEAPIPISGPYSPPLRTLAGPMCDPNRDSVITVWDNNVWIDSTYHASQVPPGTQVTAAALSAPVASANRLARLAVTYSNNTMLIFGCLTQPDGTIVVASGGTATGGAYTFLEPACDCAGVRPFDVAWGDFKGNGEQQIVVTSTPYSGGAYLRFFAIDEQTLEIARIGDNFVAPDPAILGEPDLGPFVVPGRYIPQEVTPTSSPFPPYQLALIWNGGFTRNTEIDSYEVNLDDWLVTRKQALSQGTTNVEGGGVSGPMRWFPSQGGGAFKQQSDQLVVTSKLKDSSDTLIWVVSFTGDLQMAVSERTTQFTPCDAGFFPTGTRVIDEDIGNFFNTGTDEPPQPPNLQIAVLFRIDCEEEMTSGITRTNYWVGIWDTTTPKGGLVTPNELTLAYKLTTIPQNTQSPGNLLGGLVAGDTRQRSLYVGEPTVVRITGVYEPTFVMAAPPMHLGYIIPVGEDEPTALNISAVPSDFFTRYFSNTSTQVGSSHSSTDSFTFGFAEEVEGKVKVKVPFEGGVDSTSVKVTVASAQTFENSVEKFYNNYATVDFAASTQTGWGDQVFDKQSRFNIYIYPVLNRTVCPSDTPGCSDDEKRPLQLLFSGPDMIDYGNINALNVEFYQPAHEPGQIFSYPATTELLETGRKLFSPNFTFESLTSTSGAEWFTDSSVQTQQIEWESAVEGETTVGSDQDFSFDASVTVKGKEKTAIASSSGSLTLSNSENKAFETLNTSTVEVEESKGIEVNKPGTFRNPFQYAYAAEAYVVGRPKPVGSTQTQVSQGDLTTHGLIEIVYTADPTDEMSGNWWSSSENVYTNFPDPALNHPNRWTRTIEDASKGRNCLPGAEDRFDCFEFNFAGTSGLWTDEFYHMRGFFITPQLEGAQPGVSAGGKQLHQATAGDQLVLQARVYNYSLAEMPPGTTLHVAFYGQEWKTSSPNANTPIGDSFSIGEIAPDGFRIPAFSTTDLNWSLVGVPFDTTPYADKFLIFGVVVWTEDASGKLVGEVPGHGLLSLNCAVGDLLTKLPCNNLPGWRVTDLPVEEYSNNVGYYKVPFFIAAPDSDESALLAQPEATTQDGLIFESVTVSSARALLNQKLEVAAVLRNNGDQSLDGLRVTFFDGDPEVAGNAFDVEHVTHIGLNQTYEVRVPYRARTCGLHTLSVETRSGGSQISDSAEVYINCVSQTAILATNGISLGKNSQVASGNVIDNAGDGKITVGKGSTTAEGFGLIADRVNVQKKAEVASDVTFNSLKNKGSITGDETEGVGLPVFDNLPDFETAPAGSEKIVVGKNESRMLSAGDYGKIVVKKGGTLTFTGGVYNVHSIKAKKRSSLLFDAATKLRVAKNLKASKDTFIGPSTEADITAGDIVFYVAGNKVKLGANSLARANFYAPDGRVNFKGSEATGALIGEKIKTGKGSTISLESSFGE